MDFNGNTQQYRRLSAVCANCSKDRPCDEGKKPPLCNFTPASESESADFTSVYLVAAVSSSHGIA